MGRHSSSSGLRASARRNDISTALIACPWVRRVRGQRQTGLPIGDVRVSRTARNIRTRLLETTADAIEAKSSEARALQEGKSDNGPIDHDLQLVSDSLGSGLLIRPFYSTSTSWPVMNCITITITHKNLPLLERGLTSTIVCTSPCLQT